MATEFGLEPEMQPVVDELRRRMKAVALAPSPAALTIEEFRLEVIDKLSVVFNGCGSVPLARHLHRNQCEKFLVERYAEALALARPLAALEALADEVERFAKREVAMSRFTGHQDDTLKRWVARLRTLPPASAPMSDWQLIETAPESVPVCTKIDDARGCRNECH